MLFISQKKKKNIERKLYLFYAPQHTILKLQSTSMQTQNVKTWTCLIITISGWRPDLLGEADSSWVTSTVICGYLFLWSIPARVKKFEEHSGHISYMYVKCDWAASLLFFCFTVCIFFFFLYQFQMYSTADRHPYRL